MLIVPVGATSIHIDEVAASRNVLGEDSLGAGVSGVVPGSWRAWQLMGPTLHSGEEHPG